MPTKGLVDRMRIASNDMDAQRRSKTWDIKAAFGLLWVGMTLQASVWGAGGFAVISILPILFAFSSSIIEFRKNPSNHAVASRP